MFGQSSGLSLGLGHGNSLNDGLSDGLQASSGQPSPNATHPTSVFNFERDRKDKNHHIVRAAGIMPPGLPPILSVVFAKSKPNVVMFAGNATASASILAREAFPNSQPTTTYPCVEYLLIDNAGNYVFDSSAMGHFTWKMDELSGNLHSVQDAAGIQVARFKQEGMLSGVKTLEILVNSNAAITEFIIFSAAVTRIYKKGQSDK